MLCCAHEATPAMLCCVPGSELQGKRREQSFRRTPLPVYLTFLSITWVMPVYQICGLL